MIQRKLLAVLGLLTIVGSLMYISWPVGHIPPYDANFVRLAESELQGYCAGETLLKAGDANMTARCRDEKSNKYSNKPNLGVVIDAFCQGVVDVGWEGTKKQCRTIMIENEYWPTYDGSISDQWNRARPYPGSFLNIGGNSQNGGSRTGDHNGNSRPTNPARSYGGY